MHRIVNCIEQLTVNQQNTSFWKFNKRSNGGISLNWSTVDEVTTRNTTAYFLAHSVYVFSQYVVAVMSCHVTLMLAVDKSGIA